jgi:heme/copper-type cytochrome/quinol oxidase subunit 4
MFASVAPTLAISMMERDITYKFKYISRILMAQIQMATIFLNILHITSRKNQTYNLQPLYRKLSIFTIPNA